MSSSSWVIPVIPGADQALNLLVDGRFSDFIVECGEYSFPVHKTFLCTQSGYFQALLSSPMKESLENKVTFEYLKPSLTARVIFFCYNQRRYPDILKPGCLPKACEGLCQIDRYTKDPPDSFSRAMLAVEMYKLGQRFSMDTLTGAALRNFESYYSQLDNNNIAPQSMLCEEKCSKLIREIYNGVPAQSALRRLITATLVKLFQEGRGVMHELDYMIDMIEEIPELSNDIAKSHINLMNTDAVRKTNRTALGPSIFVVDFVCQESYEFWVKYDSTVQDIIDFRKGFWPAGEKIAIHCEGQELPCTLPLRNFGLPLPDSWSAILGETQD